VFQNVYFDCVIALVDGNKTPVTNVDKQLQITLRYHDTYDIVTDQSILQAAPGLPTHIDASSGMCALKIGLKTLTAVMESRAFCIEVRSAEGDIESAFSPPVSVMREMLRIVEQPPEVWFKDEGGREKCMTVRLMLNAAPGARVEDRVIPLQVRLLYENGNEVANQHILRLFPDMRPNMTNGHVVIAFRIDDVSKNHQGQSFVIEIGPEKQEQSLMFQDISPVLTTVIAIRSKRNKRKLTTSRASPRSIGGTPRMVTPSAAASPMPSPSQRARQHADIPGIPSMSNAHRKLSFS